MSETSIDSTQKSDHLSNSVITGMSLIHEAVELAKSTLIVGGESGVVSSLFGGGSGGHLGVLKEKFPVPQFDGKVRFDDSIDSVTGEERHNYYVVEKYGERLFHGSCTGLIEKNFPQFDGDAAYDGMVKKGRIADPSDIYYGMSKEAVLAMWNDTGKDARNHGKQMHKTIEAFLNNAHDPHDPVWESPHNKPALDRFLQMWKAEIVGKIIPLRTELIMFDKRFEFAGQADLVYTRPEWLADPAKCKWIGVGDWKRSKKTFAEPAYGTGYGPCISLPNNSLSKYRLQMSLYASCLMRQTDFEVVELCLGIFHAAHTTYRWIITEPLYDIADRMLVERRQMNIAKYLDNLLETSAVAREFIEEFKDPDGEAEEFEVGANLQDTARSLHGLLSDLTAYGASTEEILGTSKRKRLGV